MMEEVLVNGIGLFFLADSPMHAEVTNTPNPGPSSNPCQIGHLKTDGMANKKKLNYVNKLLMINPDGFKVFISQSLFSLLHF